MTVPPSPETAEPTAANPIAVGDIVALGVGAHWAEAVAVIEELCDLLSHADPGSSWVPDSSDVLITAHGTVMIRPGASGTQDVDDLGRMLHSLLDPAATPMPIRLFLTQSIGFDKFTSVEGFAEALAYYARPGRTELIHALYLRCLDLPADAPLQAPPPIEEPTETEVPPKRRRRVAPALTAAIVCVLVVSGAAWFWASNPSGTSVASIKEAVIAAASATAERVGLTSSAAGAGARPDVSADAREPARSRVTSRRSEPSTARRREAASLEASAAAPGGSPPAATPDAPVIEGGLARAPVETISAAPPTVTDPNVYSSESPGVQAPVMYFPQLPPLAPAAPNAVGTNTMRLLIDEAGVVQEAKLTSRPVRLPDMTLLSAAKTWKFRPAIKDGKPVKYRLDLSWTVAPP